MRLGTNIATALVAGIIGWLMLPDPVTAQDVRLGLRVYKEKAQCVLCHGWAGNGEGEMDNPAPSIRKARLDKDTLTQVVRCGRPSAGMPYHVRNAYTNDAATSCYGITEAQLGAQKPPATRAFLSEQELEAVAAYVMTWIMGHGDPTKEECEFYFGAGAGDCRKY